MADVLAFRMRQRPVRTAAAISTIVVSIFYLLAQMVGAGALVALLLGISRTTFLGMTRHARSSRSSCVGVLMIVYVTVGGMKGTTWVQIVKAVLLMAGTLLIDRPGAGEVQLQPLRPARRRPPTAAGKGEAFLEPGLQYGVEATDDSTQDRLHLAGPRPGARHRRPAAHPDPLLHGADRARPPASRVLWAIGIIGAFYLMTLALGFGAAALVGTDGDHARRTRPATPPRRSWPRRSAAALGGDRRRGPAGDHRGGRLRHHPRGGRRADPGLVVSPRARPLRQRAQARARRPSGRRCGSPGSRPFVIGAVADRAGDLRAEPQRRVPGGAGLRGRRLGATCRRSSTACSGGGSTPAARSGRSTAACSSAVLLVFFSPVVSGAATSMFPDHDWHWFPLYNPGIISIPFGFLCGWIGTSSPRSTTRTSTPSWRCAPSPAPAPTDRGTCRGAPLLTRDVSRGPLPRIRRSVG